MVIHRETYVRLAKLAEFIVRSLQFVDQVSLMGLELMGFAESRSSVSIRARSRESGRLMELIAIIGLAVVRTAWSRAAPCAASYGHVSFSETTAIGVH